MAILEIESIYKRIEPNKKAIIKVYTSMIARCIKIGYYLECSFSNCNALTNLLTAKNGLSDNSCDKKRIQE